MRCIYKASPTRHTLLAAAIPQLPLQGHIKCIGILLYDSAAVSIANWPITTKSADKQDFDFYVNNVEATLCMKRTAYLIYRLPA